MRTMMLASAVALAFASLPAAVIAQGAAGADSTTAATTGDADTDSSMPSSSMPDSSASTPSAPPAGAQATDMAQADKPTLTADQQAMYDAWTPAQQTDYAAWPNEYKVYYWGLTADQQKGYWALTADQRGQIYKMTPQQQQLAWTSVVQQLNGQTPTTPSTQANPPGQGMPTAGVPDPKMAGQTVRPAMPADQSYQGGPYKGALTPPPATAMAKEYPVCSKTVQDNCRNRGGV